VLASTAELKNPAVEQRAESRDRTRAAKCRLSTTRALFSASSALSLLVRSDDAAHHDRVDGEAAESLLAVSAKAPANRSLEADCRFCPSGAVGGTAHAP
jgi:hypothetical protein